MKISKLPIEQIIGEKEYAWKIMELQSTIQCSEDIEAQWIANLLSLYMKGVEKMNSLSDQREAYFQKKISKLMNQSSVLQILANYEQPTSTKISVQPISITPQNKPKIIHRKQQFQNNVRRQSQTEKQCLNKILQQHVIKSKKLQQTICEIIKASHRKLQTRIYQKKVKLMSTRAHSAILFEDIIQSFKSKLDTMSNNVQKQNPTRIRRTSLQTQMIQMSTIRRKTFHSIDAQFFDQKQQLIIN